MRIRERFNPRAPCGARHARRLVRWQLEGISTHAPLAGRDALTVNLWYYTESISTHAPLAGRDVRWMACFVLSANFNPRAPCGARLFVPNRLVWQH